MRFPPDRVRYRRDYEGRTSDHGFIILNLKGLDIEGVNHLVLEAQDIKAAMERGESETQAADAIRRMLGD